MRPERPFRLSILAAAVLALGACATTTGSADRLAQARAAHALVQANPEVRRFAPHELAAADNALMRAETAARAGRDEGQVAHEAYLAERAAQVARESAMARAARAEIAQTDEERERLLLQARAREIESERARAQAERAHAQAQAEQRQKERVQTAKADREVARADLATQVEALQDEVSGLEARDTDRGLVLAMDDKMLFDPGKTAIKPGAKPALDRLAELLRERRDVQVMVEGFTDSRGSEARNAQLSSERAHAVRWALVSRGVSASRLRAHGRGEADPVASNATPEGRQRNRRVEVVLAEPGEAPAAAVGSSAPQRGQPVGTPPPRSAPLK